MALTLITNTNDELTDSDQWGELVVKVGKGDLGMGLSIPVFTLTNWDSSTDKPAVAEGSIIEVGGSLYQADGDTALTDEAGLSDGTCHIKLVPAVDGLTVTPTLTNDSIPTWDATKSGWYDGADKFLPFEMIQGGTGTTWSVKGEYLDPEANILRGVDNSYTNIKTNSILEKTDGSGITIDGALIKDTSIDSYILPKLEGSGTLSVTTSGTIIPRGAYNIWNESIVDIAIEVYDGSNWYIVYSDARGFIFSDGVNVRAKSSSGTVNMGYQKY